MANNKPANYDTGKAMRAKVLGADYVAKAVSNPEDFAAPLQDIVTSTRGAQCGLVKGLSPEFAVLPLCPC